MDKIHIEGLQLQAIIGVYDWERQAPQKLVLDIVLGVSLTSASLSDNLAHTVDYAQVAKDMELITQNSQPQLLERMAGQMCQHILDNYAVQEVDIKLSKPSILPQANNIAVQLHRFKNDSAKP